jgi:ABC-type phosphate/phosphonate transport system ATPase subunit
MATLIEKHEVIENLLHATLDRTNKLQEALLAIIAEEKPTSNATVKRICNMAREGVKQ